MPSKCTASAKKIVSDGAGKSSAGEGFVGIVLSAPRLPKRLERCLYDVSSRSWVHQACIEDVPADKVEGLLRGYTHQVERARSGLATCKGCGEKIAKAEIRLGYPYRDHRGQYGAVPFWFHVRCLSRGCGDEVLMSAVDKGDQGMRGSVFGYDSLKKAEREQLCQDLQQDRNGSGDGTHLAPAPAQLTREKLEPHPAPPTMRVALLKFQAEGLGWMLSREADREMRGGILADEMGMGKTLQTISLLLASPVPGPTLVVCPAAAMLQWRNEIMRFVEPDALTVELYYGFGRRSMSFDQYKRTVVLTTYQTLEADHRAEVNKGKVPCQWCGRLFLPEKLRFHQKYFCGPEAQRTEKQSKQDRKRDFKNEAVKRMKIGGKETEITLNPLTAIRNASIKAARRLSAKSQVGGPQKPPRPEAISKTSANPSRLSADKAEFGEAKAEVDDPKEGPCRDDGSETLGNPSGVSADKEKRGIKRKAEPPDQESSSKLGNFCDPPRQKVGCLVLAEPEKSVPASAPVVKDPICFGSNLKGETSSGKIVFDCEGGDGSRNEALIVKTWRKSALNNHSGAEVEKSDKPGTGWGSRLCKRGAWNVKLEPTSNVSPCLTGVDEGESSDLELVQQASACIETPQKQRNPDYFPHPDVTRKQLNLDHVPHHGADSDLELVKQASACKETTKKQGKQDHYLPRDADSDIELFGEIQSGQPSETCKKVGGRLKGFRKAGKPKKSGQGKSNKASEAPPAGKENREDDGADAKSKKSAKSQSNKENKATRARREESEDDAAASVDFSVSPLFKTPWTRIVLDEAHRIKGRTNSTAQAAFALRSAHARWCLSGTPVQNRIGEFWSILRFLRFYPYAHYFCSKRGCKCESLHYRFDPDTSKCLKCGHTKMQHRSHFANNVSNPIKRFGFIGAGKAAIERLRIDVMDKIVLRRTKVERADDVKLPPLEIKLRRDKLSPEEEDFYSSMYTQSRTQFDTFVDQGTILHNYAHVFDLIMRLRQAVDHPYLIIHGSLASARMIPTRSRDATHHDVCVLCQDDIEAPDRSSAACGHAFHRDCAMEYLEQAPKLPGGGIGCPACFLPLTLSFEDGAGDGEDKDAEEGSNPPRESSSQPTDAEPSQAPPAIATKICRSIMQRIKTAEFKTSTKIEALMQELEIMQRNDPSSKALVFSQFSRFLEIVEWRIKRQGISCASLLGSMPITSRNNIVITFQTDPSLKVLLISLKAGGEGLNLQAADHIFVMDPWWNPAAEMQAIHRAHRIGQLRTVKATRFLATGTIEEKIVELQHKKQAVFDSTVGGSNEALTRLSAEDIQFLFSH